MKHVNSQSAIAIVATICVLLGYWLRGNEIEAKDCTPRIVGEEITWSKDLKVKNVKYIRECVRHSSMKKSG